MNPIHVIGMGQGRQDLTAAHLSLIDSCDVLVGGRRLLELFDTSNKQTLPVNADIDGLMDSISRIDEDRMIVVLASGDPLFHGIGSTLIKYFDRERIHIHSNISIVSAAFAAIKEPWHDAKIVSLHGKQPDSFLFSELSDVCKVAFLTDLQKDPRYIATELIEHGFEEFNICVLECIGDLEKETIRWFDAPASVLGVQFSQPNVVILIRQSRPAASRRVVTHIGMDDSLFQHSKGLITKSEIRGISLSKLRLVKKDHVLWDIGSGSGSVGIEASFLIPHGSVYLIEKNAKRISDIVNNIRNFNCLNTKVLNANFPEDIQDLPGPDRIFIGGGGQGLESVLQFSCDALDPGGIVVVNTVLIQNLDTAVRVFEDKGFAPDAVQVQVSKMKKMPYGQRFESLNPVWIVSGVKPGKSEIS